MNPLLPRSVEPIDIRAYRESDAAGTLAIFLAAITETASADYTGEQVEAWADPGGRDLAGWGAAMVGRESFVATIDDELVGFSDVSDDGYIDMMFVAPGFGRRGIATRLVAHGEQLARERGVRELTANVSITARPFFERHGFSVLREQEVVRHGVTLRNFRMRKPLRALPVV